MNKRPSWDEYFLKLADLVSTRSPDPRTKHGCVITDKFHRVKSLGYNGPIQGIDDSQIPTEAPDKYFYFLHSEDNAILQANGSVEGCTVYITGFPCSACLRRLIQAKVSRIVYGNRKSNCIDIKDREASNLMIKLSGIEILQIRAEDYTV